MRMGQEGVERAALKKKKKSPQNSSFRGPHPSARRNSPKSVQQEQNLFHFKFLRKEI